MSSQANGRKASGILGMDQALVLKLPSAIIFWMMSASVAPELNPSAVAKASLVMKLSSTRFWFALIGTLKVTILA